MTFAAPLWLLAALAAGIVILLHAMRRTLLPVASTLIWRQLSAANRAQSVPRLPKWNWLLVLQLLAVLLIAIALARPQVGAANTAEHHIHVLDVSGSMSTVDLDQQTSRFENAATAIRADIAALDPSVPTRLSLITIGPQAQPTAVRYDDVVAFEEALSRVERSDGIAVADNLAELLDGIIKEDEANSIFYHADALPETVGTLPDFTFVAQGRAETANAGLRAQAVAAEKDGVWTVSGELFRTNDAAVEKIALRYRPSGGQIFLDMGSITPRAARDTGAGYLRSEFTSDITLPGPGILELSLPPDAAAFDNVTRLIIGEPGPTARALYIGPGNKPVELALAVNPELEVFTAREVPADVDTYDLVLIDSVALPIVPKTNVVWLGSARGPNVAAPTPAPTAAVLSTNAEHPLARGISWQSVATLPVFGFDSLPGAVPLVSTDAGPAIEARTTPYGREVRIALAFENAAWVEGEQLPLLVNRILTWSGALIGANQHCVVGEVCTVPARELGTPISNADGEVVWSWPNTATDVLPDALTDSFIPNNVGLLSTASGRQIAVNAPSSESMQAVSPKVDAVAPAGGFQLWRWLLISAITVLLIEAFLAGRSDDRFLQPASLASGVPGATRRRWMLGTRLAAIAAAVAALFVPALPALTRSADIVHVGNEASGECGFFSLLDGGQVTATGKPSVAKDIGCSGVGASAELAAGTNLSGALSLAAAMTGSDTERRVVIDGISAETVGHVAEIAPTLIRQDIAVDLVKPETSSEATTNHVIRLETPAPVFDGDAVPVVATIQVDAAGTKDVTLSVDAASIHQSSVDLVAGTNRVELTIPTIAEGAHRVDLSVDGMQDSGFGTIVDVRAAPKVAIVTPQLEWGEYLAEALTLQGLRPTVLRPDRAPFLLDRWREYDSVVLLNTPAIDLATVQQQQLEEYVRVHGGGLLILGGENTFGPGGYFRTPLEDVSPLSARVPDDLPIAALAFVLDRSGSMQAQVDGATRLDIAKQATLSAVELLNDESQISVIVFDTESHVIAPMSGKNMEGLQAALAPVQPGGGTFFMPALEDALVQLDVADAPVRHIILMSDGLSQPGDYDAFAARAQEAGITMSVVAIGAGADVGRLGAIARNGGGSFHSTTDFRALPSILSQEAMMLSGEPMKEGVQPTVWSDRSARFLEGLPDALPPIQGFVETTPKPEATIHMQTTDEEGELVPLLASWNYGNGNVLAFATHGAGMGTAQWLKMDSYPLLWSQVIRHFAHGEDKGDRVAMTREGDVLTLTTRADIGHALVSQNGQEASTLQLRAQADGLRSARFLAAPGEYRIEFPETEIEALRYVVNRPADPPSQTAALEALARATGGAVYARASEVPGPSLSLGIERVWRPLVVLGLILFLLDLGMRYAPGHFPFLRDRRRKAVA